MVLVNKEAYKKDGTNINSCIDVYAMRILVYVYVFWCFTAVMSRDVSFLWKEEKKYLFYM